MSRLLVIGAAGLVGREVSQTAIDGGHEVLAADLLSMPSTHSEIPWLKADMRVASALQAILDSYQPDAVAVLAAKHFIPWCNAHPSATLATNVIGLSRVVDALAGSNCRLVFTSSAAVYGPSAQPLSESSPIGPDDIYGTSKVMGEQLLRLRSQETGLHAVILRLFNVIGPNDPTPHLLPRVVNTLAGGSRHLKLGNLDSVRDYIAVADVATAIVAALTKNVPSGTTVNIGTGKGHTVEELVQTCADLLGDDITIDSVPSQRRAVDRPVLLADSAAARQVLGWAPETTFREGVARTMRAVGLPVTPAPQA